MAKRFTDTEKFSDTWYRKLSLLHKVIWEYLLAECNHAGILENFDLEMMSFKIGAEVTMEDLEKFENRIIFISDSVLYIPKFIEFQYGTLNAQSKVHASVLRELEKYKINTLSIEYDKSINTLKDKNKNKNKDKDKEIDTKLYGEYFNVCLSNEQYGKLLTMCSSQRLLDELIYSFSINIEIGKERPYTADLPNAHFERLKSYYNFRRRNPEKFAKENKRPDSKVYIAPEPLDLTEEEKEKIKAIQANIKSMRAS